MQSMLNTSARIGRYKGQILPHAIAKERLSRAGRQIKMPPNNSDTYVGRRFLPYGATASDHNSQNRFFQAGTGDRGAAIVSAHLSQEGINEHPDILVPVDVSVVLQEYSCLYGFTSRTFELHEDDLPEEMRKQVGERITFVNELIIYGALRQCTNVYYGGAGTSISTVNGAITLPLLRRVARNLYANHAETINSMLSASPDFASSPVEEGYDVYHHSNLVADIRDLTGFIHAVKYASGKPRQGELGAIEDFRFFPTPDLPELQDAGAAVGGTGLLSTSGSNIDVYPVIVTARNAWSQVALRGVNAIDPTYLPPGKKDKSDPHGRRGLIGAKWKKSVLLENHGWMAVLYVGSRNLA